MNASISSGCILVVAIFYDICDTGWAPRPLVWHSTNPPPRSTQPHNHSKNTEKHSKNKEKHKRAIQDEYQNLGDFLQFNFSVDLFVPLAELHFLNFATSSKDYSFNCAKDDFFLPRRMIWWAKCKPSQSLFPPWLGSCFKTAAVQQQHKHQHQQEQWQCGHYWIQGSVWRMWTNIWNKIPGLDRLSRWDLWIVCLEIFGIPMGLPAPDIYPLSPLLVIRLHWMRITNMESAPTERWVLKEFVWSAK